MTQKMFLIILTMVFITLSAQTPITIYDFEDETMDPSFGTGTLTTIGGISTTWVLGWGGSGEGGRALNTASYPAQGTDPETAGIRIHVSTQEHANILLSWNNRQSATSSSRLRLQYTVDGATWLNFEANESNATNQRIFPTGVIGDIDFDDGMYVYAETNSWFYRTANFSSIAGVNNNPNFAFRFVTAFQSGTSEYAPVGTNYASGGTIRFDNITLSFIDENAVMTPIASPAGTTYTTPIEVELSTQTPDASIYFTINGEYPDNVSGTLYAEPILINENTTLRFKAYKEGMTPSIDVTEEYILPIVIHSLEQLREYEAGTGLLFFVESEVHVTFTQEFRNQKFVQDDTAGILIDDFSEIIQTEYKIGDGIVGLMGNLVNFGGLLQFTPISDPGEASSTDNTIIPLVITMQNFIEDFDKYESRLVALENVSFVSPEGNFAIARTYPITDGTHTIHFRATFETDYLGTPIPTENITLIGLLTERTDGRFITARFLDDFRKSSSDYDTVSQLTHMLIGNFPNPFNPSTTIAFELKYETHLNISIFNIRGQRVNTLINEVMEAGTHNVHWNGIDENGNEMASGIYFYRMLTPEQIFVRRAILLK
ncbi:MAG: chitobiase/beta-hexosaminidase C-terminal domain-containing protein [Candidatus Cloacimonetes bacterium]|nr:chitobiase/beta-hexosaminidase C-terminal domain-containing protein [Candidatus Cloacimonadota bacterium]